MVSSPSQGRACVWVVLALCSLAALWRPSEPSEIAFLRGAGGCFLGFAKGAPRCGCGELPGQLRRLFGLPIPLNRANAADLEALPGIGPLRARAIVTVRAHEGPFRAVDDLERLRGLGPATVMQVRRFLFVDGLDPACQDSRFGGAAGTERR